MVEMPSWAIRSSLLTVSRPNGASRYDLILGSQRSAPMMSVTRLLAVLAVVATICVCSAQPSRACEIVMRHRGLPVEGRPLFVGVVAGYPSTEVSARGAGLFVSPELVISGPVNAGIAHVIPYSYGPDCSSTPERAEVIREQFPVGTRVAVVTALTTSQPAGSVIVESNAGGFIIELHDDLPRTGDGDLDFEFAWKQHGYGNPTFGMLEVEFARSVAELRRADPRDRVRRAMNLVHHDAFMPPDGSQLLDRLLNDLAISGAARRPVLAAYDAHLEAVRRDNALGSHGPHSPVR